MDFNVALVQALPRLRATAMRLTHSADQADDLVNDTVVNALRAQHQFIVGTNMSAWLTVICRNYWYSSHRRKQFIQPAMEGQAEMVPCLSNQFEHTLLNETLIAIDKLPDYMRDALVDVGMGDLTYEQAAAKAHVPTGTIKSRVSRARTRLMEGGL